MSRAERVSRQKSFELHDLQKIPTRPIRGDRAFKKGDSVFVKCIDGVWPGVFSGIEPSILGKISKPRLVIEILGGGSAGNKELRSPEKVRPAGKVVPFES